MANNPDIIPGQNYSATPLLISEIDGLPMIAATHIKVPSGRLTSMGNGVVTIETGKEAYAIITVTTPNQVTFTLPFSPLDSASVRMFIEGGIELVQGIDFSVSLKTVSYLASSPSFDVGEKIVFKFMRTAL